jgi:hypothetical protein
MQAITASFELATNFSNLGDDSYYTTFSARDIHH